MIPNRLPQELHPLWQEMDAYYRPMRGNVPEAERPEGIREAHKEIYRRISEFEAAGPERPAVLIKSQLHEIIAECFVPQLFRHTPFFFEMGLRTSENWGTPWSNPAAPAAWLMRRRLTPSAETRCIEALHLNSGDNPIPLWHGQTTGFDFDHHCIGTTRLLETGIDGLIADIEKRQTQPCDTDQAATLQAMAQSCRAVLRIAERFGRHAQQMLEHEREPQARGSLRSIVETCARIPAQAPRTFLEGLAMLWFLREVSASIEAIGISVIGHPDRQLIHLYRADIDAGRLTEAEARDLLARWLMVTDVKTFARERAWPETSTCLELGGCDVDGAFVWNDLTRLILEVHRDCDLINPKLNCRFNSDAPQDYLKLIATLTLDGHNHLALLNDDVLVPAQVRRGKSLEDARRYVNGGCQETMCEGVEHSAGAHYYFNLPEILALMLGTDKHDLEALPVEASDALPPALQPMDTFEELYQNVIAGIHRALSKGAEWRARSGGRTPGAHPCPWFSATLEGCIANAADYTSGGAKYNPSGICLVGLGTLVDALEAMRIAVYEEQWITLPELKRVLDANWEGAEPLRQRLLHHPRRYGRGAKQTDALAARVSRDITGIVHALPNERGDRFQASYFVYYAFKNTGIHTPATPDGRRHGDLLSQGVAPSRMTPVEALSDVFISLSRINFEDAPGNAVLDLQLPFGGSVSPEILVALMRNFARIGGPTLQFNCVSQEQLRDAQAHPESHQDLVVRISGLSACFVKLNTDVQDEIIDRTVLAQI